MTQRATNLGKLIGDSNLRLVREWVSLHPFGTRRECAEALGLSVMAVGRHANKLRAEWATPTEAPMPKEKQ